MEKNKDCRVEKKKERNQRGSKAEVVRDFVHTNPLNNLREAFVDEQFLS